MPDTNINMHSAHSSLEKPFERDSAFQETAPSAYSHDNESLQPSETKPDDPPPAPWRALFHFTKRSHLPLLITGLIAAIVCGTASPAQSLLIGKAFGLFSDYKIGKITGQELLSHETTYVFYLLAVAGASWLAHFVFFACWLSFGELQAKSAREELFATLLRRDQTWYDTRDNGITALISRTHQQVRELQLATAQPFGGLLSIIADVCFSFGVAMFYSWKLTLVIVSTLPIMLVVFAWLGSRMHSHVNAQHDALSHAIKNLKNALVAIDVVKCFTAQTFEAARYMARIHVAARAYFRMVNINGQQAGVAQFVGSAMFVQGFYYGGVLVNNGEKSVADVVTTFMAAMGAFGTISNVVSLLLPLEKGRAAAVAIRAIVDNSLVDELDAALVQEGPCRGEIELQNITFTYPTRPDSFALNDVSFRIPAGQTTYVLGRSGSGKSTLAQLLLGFYGPDSGTLRLDGRDIRDYSPTWLRNNIALVEQSPSLFDLSIKDNIALGSRSPDASTDIDLISAAEFAQLNDLVWGTQTGINTPCGPNGALLSGGQRQRVAIARARLRDTPILILDEPTSALDHITRTRLMNELRRWRAGKTTIIVTHDYSLIRPDDIKIVLEDGHVISGATKHVPPGGPALKHAPSRNFSRPGTTSRLSRGPSRLSASRQSFYEDDLEASRKYRSSFIPSMFSAGKNVFGSPFLAHTGPAAWTGRGSTPPESPVDDHASVSARRMSQSAEDSAAGKRISMGPLRAIFAESAPGPFPRRLSTRVNSFRMSVLTPIGTVPQPSQPASTDPASSASSPSTHSRSITSILRTVWPSLDLPHRLLLISAMILCIIHAAITPIFAYVLSGLISTFGIPNSSSKALKHAMAILGIAFVDAWCVYGLHVLLERVGQRWIDTLRGVAVRRVLSQPKAFFESSAYAADDGSDVAARQASDSAVHDPESVQERTKSDKASSSTIPTAPDALVESLDRNGEETRNLLGRFLALVLVASFMVLISLIWSLSIAPKLTGLCLVSGPYIYAVTRVFGRVNAIYERKSADASEGVNALLNTLVGAIPTIRALCLQGYFSGKFREKVAGALRVGVRRAGFTAILFGQSEASGVLVQALVFYLGARLTADTDRESEIRGREGVDVTIQVFLLMIMTATNIGSILTYIPQVNLARDAGTRFLRLVELSERSHEDEGRMTVGEVEQIHFRDVRFRYPGAQTEALRGCNFFVEKGTSVAIVGPSGSGKSTILGLLLKLYPLNDPGRGSKSGLLISGRHIGRIDTTFLRQHMALVPQAPTLLSGTIAENITYGLPYATTAAPDFLGAIQRAAEMAGIHEFVSSLPDGYTTQLGDGGTALSGGQAQRVALARALVRNPKVLVLDEVTSALDPHSAAHIRQVMKRLVDEHGITVIAVTHSREMMATADSVVVIGEGRVVQKGPFEELIRLTEGPLYKLLESGEQ